MSSLALMRLYDMTVPKLESLKGPPNCFPHDPRTMVRNGYCISHKLRLLCAASGKTWDEQGEHMDCVVGICEHCPTQQTSTPVVSDRCLRVAKWEN